MLESIIEVLRSNVVLVGLLVGAVTPLIVSVIQQPAWSKKARSYVAVAVSVIIGAILAAADGSLNPGDLLGTITAVYVAAEAFYQKVWKASGITDAVEEATSPTPVVPEPVLEEPAEEPEDLEYK